MRAVRALVVAAVALAAVLVVALTPTCGTSSSQQVSDTGGRQGTPPSPEFAGQREREQRPRARAEPVAVAVATPAPAAMRVVVRGVGGAAVAGANVALLASPATERFPQSEELATGVTDDDGAVGLPFSARGAVVHAWTDDASGVALLGAADQEDHACEVTLRPAPTRSVEVVDPEGRPIAGASVFAWIDLSSAQIGRFSFASNRAGTPVGWGIVASFLARSDAQGMCRVRPLPNGDVDVDADGFDIDVPSASAEALVEAVGYRSEKRSLDAASVRVELVPVVEARALVVDDAGGPIPRVAWRCSPQDYGYGEPDGHVLALVPRTSAAHELILDADGFVARSIQIVAGGPATVDLGTVALERALMFRGIVVWPDGTPAAHVLVTADGPNRKFVQGQTNAAGRFELEPPDRGEFRLSAGTPAGAMRDTGRDHVFEATSPSVLPGSETRLELRFVPSIVVELTGPEPQPPGFHWSNVVVVARSADGRAEYDWMPEDGWHGRRRVVRLYGCGPWTLVARHAAIETSEKELGTPTLTPADAPPVHRMELRSLPDPAMDAERR